MLTLQEIFDKACAGVIAQGCQSVAFDFSCAYAGPKGTACAVGQLLPSEVAEEWQASGPFSIKALRGRYPSKTNARKYLRQLNAAGVPTDRKTLDLLEALQSAHDCADGRDFLQYFRRRASSVAKRFNLTIGVLIR